MSTRQKLSPIFTAVGLPVVIGSWSDDEVPQWPFIEYHRVSPSDIYGSNKNIRIDRWQVSVYAKQKGAPAFWDKCSLLEDALTASSITYTRSDDIFTDDIVYVEYNFDLVG